MALPCNQDQPLEAGSQQQENLTELILTSCYLQVWKVRTGQCLRRFEKAHGQGITSVAFSRDASHVLSSSYDGLARVHGLKSGKMLKEFRGHTSYVNQAIYSQDSNQVICHMICSKGSKHAALLISGRKLAWLGWQWCRGLYLPYSLSSANDLLRRNIATWEVNQAGC